MLQDRYERFQAKLNNSAAVERQKSLNEIRDQTKATLRENRAARTADERQAQSLEKARATRRLKALNKKPKALLTAEDKLEIIQLQETLDVKQATDNESE